LTEIKHLKEASPLYLKGNNGKAILIIHGFTGYPGEFYELSHALNEEGYTVSLPRLPGHGTNRKDFLSTGWKDWLEHVIEAYKNLEAEYSSVSITGLSMGGVLTLILSSMFKPERIALLAPAMAVGDKSFYLTPLLKFFKKELPKDWTPEPEDSEDVKILGREYWSVHLPGQMANLYKLMRMAKRGLKHVSCPALLMLSEKDDSVPLYAGDIIETGLKNSTVKKVILKNSPHVIVSGPEKEFVKKEVIQWMNQGEING